MVGNDNITETAENKAPSTEALDRTKIARQRREAEQKKKLDELSAHAAASKALREKREQERRQRQVEQRKKDEERRQQVEERKRVIWEASMSWREALMKREQERSVRLARIRASRSSPRSEFAFGSSTPRLLEPIDSSGCYWTSRRAASTTNVMFASAPLTRRASASQLNTEDNKDEPDRRPAATPSSVARRRTDLVPTILVARAPEMRSPRSGETTPISRPSSALSNSTPVVRRNAGPRKPRPASVAGTGVNTPNTSVTTTSAMTRRITTEEEAKAALAERRRKAREELERQAELETQRLKQEVEAEAATIRLEEQRQDNEEKAREIARVEEEKLKNAIEAQQQSEVKESVPEITPEAERQTQKEDEEKRRLAEEAERLRKDEIEREEKERLARKQRVEAIMARTRLNKIADQNQEQATEVNNVNNLGPLEFTSNLSASLIQSERTAAERTQSNAPETIPTLIDDDFTAHNGHGATDNRPLTLQNAM